MSVMGLCGGFLCTKNALTALNSIYILVGVLLMVVGGVAKGASVVTSLPAVAGIIAAGVFLFLVAILGLYGASRHHQYMVILFLIFLIQFFVAVACLAVSEEQVKVLVTEKWSLATPQVAETAMREFHCCAPGEMDGDSAAKEECFKVLPGCKEDACPACTAVIPPRAIRAIHVAGGISLFFSFSEFFGVWLTMRFRNQRDPRYNHRNFI